MGTVWKQLLWLLGHVLDPGLHSPYGLVTLLGLSAFTCRLLRQLGSRYAESGHPARPEHPPQEEKPTAPKHPVNTTWLVLGVLFLLLMTQA